MKILNEFPPNYKEIKAKFPNLEESKPLFAYGDTIYNPFNAVVTPDLEVHEAVHSVQQGDEPEKWWDEYLKNPQFRLEMEIQAYAAQYKYFKDSVPAKVSRWLLERTALALSGELYGNLISYGEAESKIRNRAKSI